MISVVLSVGLMSVLVVFSSLCKLCSLSSYVSSIFSEGSSGVSVVPQVLMWLVFSTKDLFPGMLDLSLLLCHGFVIESSLCSCVSLTSEISLFVS